MNNNLSAYFKIGDTSMDLNKFISVTRSHDLLLLLAKSTKTIINETETKANRTSKLRFIRHQNISIDYPSNLQRLFLVGIGKTWSK